MRKSGNRVWCVRVRVVVQSVVILVAAGCARAVRAPDSAPDSELIDDGSRCPHTGKDLESLETRSSAARAPNVRRVFRVSANKHEPQRVLICREVDTNLDGRKDVFRELDNRGQVTRESADSDYDGQLDTWQTFAGGLLRKLELDLSGDGQVDETRFYDRGALSKIQRDTNRDGKPDRWEAYEKGQLSRVGMDLDFDGRVDRWL